MIRSWPWAWTRLLALALAFTAVAASADAPPSAAGASWWSALDNRFYKVFLNLRARTELANQDGQEWSQAYTVRTRLGVGTKPLFGLTAFAEVENVFSLHDGAYHDAVESPTGQTTIADPEETELNRLWLRYANPALLGADLKVGRQRIKLDDDRFVGNVGWRQNEQTFDAALLKTDLGVEGLEARYAWIEEAHRIFGNDGSAAQKDFDSDSHVVNVAYSGLTGAKITAFAYLLDFDDSPPNSSNSYGFRLTGQRKLSDEWSLGYAASYAYQTDAEDNPVDYDAHYGAAELVLACASFGSFIGGYEHLGSDDGEAGFVTPLATAHKFNGFADVFLDNGGVDGLQDAYLGIAPRLPFGLAGRAVYHHFWSDERTLSLGDELDFVVKKKLTKNLVVLSKGAWFEGTDRGRADRWRWWFELNFSY